MLAKGKGLSTHQLLALSVFDLAHASLAGNDMLFRIHLNIVLRFAASTVVFEERAVATIEDIHLGVRECGISLDIDSSILVSDELGHQWCTMSRVFAVEDDERRFAGIPTNCLKQGFHLKQLGGKSLFVVVVLGALNVATIILILEAAVDDYSLLVAGIILAVEEIDHGLLADPRELVWLVILEHDGQLQLMSTLDIHSRRHGWQRFLLHHVVCSLVHALGSTELLSGSDRISLVGCFTHVRSQWGAITSIRRVEQYSWSSSLEDGDGGGSLLHRGRLFEDLLQGE